MVKGRHGAIAGKNERTAVHLPCNIRSQRSLDPQTGGNGGVTGIDDVVTDFGNAFRKRKGAYVRIESVIANGG